ncbi:hypothetical protein [Magnetospirillum sp. UT-4]|uniref:hypothetical protein n=1 Tax=Magnetospirillum sp. UT-4 TaxID=2681467 RepID=UPI001381932D|nr:hypothetical protein [Magnetospirillum sp. UT-4]CAA7613494.1 hypothetical protein MTBUT4_150017 [Magnetospirillum sp. UT-4]
MVDPRWTIPSAASRADELGAIQAFVNARGVSVRAGFGALQAEADTLQAFGYRVETRRQAGRLVYHVNGNPHSEARIRSLAQRLRAGRVGWQQHDGRARK